MLHGGSVEGDLGFCHSALPGLPPSGYDGPLVVAVDSNILVDLQEHRSPQLLGDEHGLPDGPDRDLVLEAQGAGAHAFMTRDRRVIRRTVLAGPPMLVRAPSYFAAELQQSGVSPSGGGVCGQEACPYVEPRLPAPDIGKWGPLFAHFDDA